MKILFFAVLFAGILVLVLFSFKKDTFDEEFLSNVEHFNFEKAQQEIVSEPAVVAGSVNVPIITYHSIRPHTPNELKIQDQFDITPELFEQELAYLKDNNYSVISMNALADYFEKGTALPSKPVILTFDDGWENQYLYAFPLLQKYGGKGTFFIFTNAVGHKNFLTWEQIIAMRNAGMEIGGHTKSHPILFHIKDANKLKDEIAGGKKILELHLGQPITVFAYPFGEYNNTITNAVKEAGYRIARCSDRGTKQTKEHLFTLKTFASTDNFSDFKKVISGGMITK